MTDPTHPDLPVHHPEPVDVGPRTRRRRNR
jgi:hypothetical protein